MLAVSNGSTISQLKSSCTAVSLNDNITNMILDSWEKKSTVLTKTLLSRTLVSNKLLDMDWSFGVTAASDDADQIGKTYLQVKMKVSSGDKGVNDIFFELTLEQFYTFLAELENCKSFLEVVSSG